LSGFELIIVGRFSGDHRGLYVTALSNQRAAAGVDAGRDVILKMVLDESKFDLDRAQAEFHQHRYRHASLN
jgi:hypothetical protein